MNQLFISSQYHEIIRISHIVIHARQLHDHVIHFLQNQMTVPTGSVKAFRNESAAAHAVFNRDFLIDRYDTVIDVQKLFIPAYFRQFAFKHIKINAVIKTFDVTLSDIEFFAVIFPNPLC